MFLYESEEIITESNNSKETKKRTKLKFSILDFNKLLKSIKLKYFE